MKPDHELLCVCGHPNDYHDGASITQVYPHESYWCCSGQVPLLYTSDGCHITHRCHCPRFRLAITEPSKAQRGLDS